jgi:hypothetical protein
MKRFRTLLVCAAIGIGIGGAAAAAGYGFSEAGLPAGDTALDIAVPVVAIAVIAPPLLSALANQLIGVRGGRRIRLAVWFYGRAGHRWYPMPSDVMTGDWDAMYRLPSNAVLLSGQLCRDCNIHRINARDAEGVDWMLLRPIPTDPHVEWIAGPMIVRAETDGSPPRWRLQGLIVSDAHDEVPPEERSRLAPYLASYPSDLEQTIQTRRSEGLTRMLGLDIAGKPFAAFRCREPDTSYTRIAGIYVVYCRQTSMPGATTTALSS